MTTHAPLRILHVSPSLATTYGGPTYSLWGYVRAALAVGCDVQVAAPACDPGVAMRPPDDVHVHDFPSHGRAAFVTSPALWRWLNTHGGEFDVVHVHGMFNPVSSLAARIAARRRWPFVIRPVGTLSRYTFTHRRGTLKRAYFAALDRSNLRRAGAIHFTTDGERENARWLDLRTGAREHVVAPPWTGGRVAPRAASTDAPTVLLLGRMHPVKAVEHLLAAWPRVLASRPDARLVLAGDGDPEYVATLQARAAALGDGARSVRFTGFVDGEAKQRLLDEASLFALPSHHENFGIAVLEAVGNGLPVVISPDVQLASFVRQHRLGIVAVRDPEPLADAIIGALRDPELHHRCRTAGAELVERHFSIPAIGARLVDMYQATRAPAPT